MLTNNTNEENILRQDDELMALKEIYGEGIIRVVSEEDGGSAQRVIKLSVIPAVEQSLQLNHYDAEGNESLITIKHLPESTLVVTLVPSYPGDCDSPPQFIFTSFWLNEEEHSETERELNELWESTRAEVLFSWIQFLTDLVTHFNIKTVNVNACFDTNLGRRNKESSCHNFSTSYQLFQYLKQNSYSLEREVFLKSTHECEVCADEYVGKDCVQFEPCKHIFCTNCTRDYYTVNVKDGAFTKLKCLSSDCDSEPSQNFIKELLDATIYQLYEKQQLKVALDSMDDVFQCPRSDCETPVIAEPESNLARCEKCLYSFCKLCLRSYHGIELCKVREDKIRKIREEYEKGDISIKRCLEQKYGKKQLMMFLNESRSLEWVNKNSKCCPSCHIQTQKTKGCNKMWCARCGCHWCWLCNAALRANDPYSHFNKQKSPCFQKLFDGMSREELMAQFEGAEEENEPQGRPNVAIVNHPDAVEVFIPPDVLGLGPVAGGDEGAQPLFDRAEGDMMVLQLEAQLFEDDDFRAELLDDGLVYFGFQ